MNISTKESKSIKIIKLAISMQYTPAALYPLYRRRMGQKSDRQI